MHAKKTYSGRDISYCEDAFRKDIRDAAVSENKNPKDYLGQQEIVFKQGTFFKLKKLKFQIHPDGTRTVYLDVEESSL